MKQKLSVEQLKLMLEYNTQYAIELEKRVVHVYGELKEDLGVLLKVKYDIIKQFYSNILNEEVKDITLDISSYGGSIYSISSGLDFFYELSKENVLVHTKASGICMSAATVLLAGGTGERMASPRCKFMLHDIQVDGVGGTASQVMHTAQALSVEQEEMFTYYAEFSRKGQEPLEEKDLKKEVKKWVKKFTKDGFDHYVTPKEMLELGLIDKIL